MIQLTEQEAFVLQAMAAEGRTIWFNSRMSWGCGKRAQRIPMECFDFFKLCESIRAKAPGLLVPRDKGGAFRLDRVALLNFWLDNH